MEIFISLALAFVGFKIVGIRKFIFAFVLFLILKCLVFKNKRPAKHNADDKPAAQASVQTEDEAGSPVMKKEHAFYLLKSTSISLLIILAYNIFCYYAPVSVINVSYTAAKDTMVYTVDEMGGFTFELPESMKMKEVKPAAGTNVVYALKDNKTGLEIEIDVYEKTREFNSASDKELISYARKKRNDVSSLASVFSTDILNIGAKRFVRMYSSFVPIHDMYCLVYATDHGDYGMMFSAFSPEKFSNEQISRFDQIVASIDFPDL